MSSKRVVERDFTKSRQLPWEDSHPPRVGPVAPVPAATCYFAGSLRVLVNESTYNPDVALTAFCEARQESHRPLSASQ